MDIDTYTKLAEEGKLDDQSTEDVIEGVDDVDVETSADDQQQPEESQEQQESENQNQEQDQQQQPKKQKRVQTPEENARFAEMRRRREQEERLQKELERRMQEMPEFQLAKRLSEMYGLPTEQLLQQLEEARLQKEAEERKVPIEILKERQEIENRQRQLEQELNRLKFEQWKARVDNEARQIRERYPMLSEEDVQNAVVFMLETLQNPDLPLESAVLAVHGQKIMDSLRDMAHNEALAEVSGRKQSPLPPQGGKTPETATLTEEERYVAKMMGISEEDYLKWKHKDSL